MTQQKRRFGGWLYGLAVLIVVLGCFAATALVDRGFAPLRSSFEVAINLRNLTQVVMPGSEEITFADTGPHAVYYEYRSSIDGVIYDTASEPPDLMCTLTARASGTEIGVVPDYVPTNGYATMEHERVGVLMGSLTIPKSGIYNLTCQYPDGRTEPDIVLAVGPNFVWEFFGVALDALVPVAASIAVLVGAGVLAGAVVVLTILRRKRSRPVVAEAKHRQSGPRDHWAWIASAASLLLVIAAVLLPRGDNLYLRASGVVVLVLSGFFTLSPFYILKKVGATAEGKPYTQTTRVVDRGPYAIVRHPQYLGCMLLAWGFALLTQHWTVVLLATVGTACFYLQALEEERACLTQFGVSYDRYRHRVPRLNIILGAVRLLGRRDRR